MADFCNKCSKIMFGDVGPDIDVQKIFDDLEDGYMMDGLICEGCTLTAIAKDGGKLKVAYLNKDGWFDYSDPIECEHCGRKTISLGESELCTSCGGSIFQSPEEYKKQKEADNNIKED